jgi:Beta-propeller repeat
VTGDYPGSPRRNLRSDAYVIKYDPAGNRVWFSRIAGENNDTGHAIAVSADGATVYVVGDTHSNFDVAGYPVTPIPCCAHADAFIVKLDGSGAIVWAHNLPPVPANGQQTFFNDEARGVATNAAGSVAFVTGHTLGVMPGETTKGARDIWVARFAGNGARDWVRQFGGGAPSQTTTINDSGLGIAIDRNGDLFVTGESGATFGTPNPDTRLSDWFVMKLRPADGTAY